MRIALLFAALDPIAELRVFELKGTGDLDPVAKCCHAYGSGADDDTIAACLKSLRQLYEVELVRRAKTIRGLDKTVCPDSKVTPELARKRSLKLHPIVFAIDEAQEAFSDPDFGKLFDLYATAVVKRGPALGIILVIATQRPDKNSLPTGITSNVAIRFCLRVMDQIANDMVLGTSAYKTGVRSTLMTVNDKGCGYLVGGAELAQVTKTFHVNGKQADAIGARARALRAAAGTLTGYALGDAGDAGARDVLGDVLAVFGDDLGLHWPVLAARLAAGFPDRWAGADADSVSAQLRGLGVASVQVKADGKGLKGCRRADVDQAAGR
jgi:S-DNA-T family DNA segregation ATPase FtsK/SpoIIIE